MPPAQPMYSSPSSSESRFSRISPFKIPAGLQAESAIHAGFLVLGNQGFQWTVLQVLGLQDSHDGSHTQAVVGTQRRTPGLYPITIDEGFDRVPGEIVHGIIVLLRHHVHVGLQDNALPVLHTRCGRLADDDVACLVHK